MRALGFVGATRLKLASEKLPPVVQHWYGQWCFGDTTKNCEVMCLAQEQGLSTVPTLTWQKAQVAGGSIRLAGDWQAIVFGAFAREMPIDETASHLMREAQLALLNEVLEALGQERVSTLKAETTAPRSGPLNAQVLLQLSVAQASVYLLLDASLLNNALAPVVPRSVLIERKQALGNAKVKLCLIGSKGLQFFRRLSGVEISASVTHLGDRPHVKDLIGAVKVMLDFYRDASIDQLLLVHNVFVNTMTQKGVVTQLLPLQVMDQGKLQERWDYIYEPGSVEILDGVLLRYIESQVFQGAVENVACEMAARMVAMKSASDNAGNLIDELQLIYNKARQAAITKELSEIVGGAAAV